MENVVCICSYFTFILCVCVSVCLFFYFSLPFPYLSPSFLFSLLPFPLFISAALSPSPFLPPSSFSPSPHPFSPFYPPPYSPLLLPLFSSSFLPLLFYRNGMTPTFARTMYERGVERMASLLGFSDISMSKTSVSAVNGLLQSSKLSKLSSKQQKIEMVTRAYIRTYINTWAYNDFFFFSIT